MQYDAHVQQVVDEKISMECNLATREARMVKESYGDDGMSVPVKSDMSFVVKQSMGDGKQEEDATTMRTEMEEIPVLPKRGRMEDHQQKVVGWLEITEGSIQGGNPLSRPLREGEYVMIAAKVKQVKRVDTMMTRCGMDSAVKSAHCL